MARMVNYSQAEDLVQWGRAAQTKCADDLDEPLNNGDFTKGAISLINKIAEQWGFTPEDVWA